MRALPSADQLDRFYALWTLKEAYIKARGLGLAIPLHTFHFELGGAGPTVCFEPALPRMSDGNADDATRWAFDLSHRGDHLVAIAARAAAPLRVSVHDVTAIGPGDVLVYSRVG
jgi:4'-phosphopantetheinyl transferase